MRRLAIWAVIGAMFAVDTSSAVDWIGGTGAWLNGSNWSGGSPPTFFDDANINNGGTAQLSGSDVGDANLLNLGGVAGTSGNLEMSGGQLFPEQVRIGEAGTGTATVSGGGMFVGNSSLFIGGQNDTGTGTLNITGPTATVESGDDIQFGRVGNGTLNMSDGRMEGVFTVVGKFGTGTWNQSGGLFVARADMEIGDGGTPAQSTIAGPRTGNINLSGGVIQAEDFAIGNRVGSGTVNVSGTGYLAVTRGDGRLWIGRGMDWAGNPGAGGATELRVTGGDAIVVVNEDFFMNVDNVASSSTLVAEITGTSHTPIKVAGNADLTNGAFRVELNGYTPSSGDSWTILQTGATFSSELATIDGYISANGYAPIFHDPPALIPGTLNGTTFAVEDLSAPLPAGLSWSLDYTTTDVILSVVGTGVTGDFNNDGFWNCADINALSAAIASSSTDLSFDMNGDGVITAADITDAGDGWLAVGGANNPAQTGGGAFLNGDANLSGGVDGSDFGIWNTNKFSSTSDWCLGDFNASGGVDGSDFGIWNGNKFQSSASSSAAVPEPMVPLTLLLIGLAWGARARR